MSKITVIGSMNMDCVATMDRFPKPGETLNGNDLNYYFGGKGINQCVSVARLGGDVEMVGCVGKDSDGDAFLHLLEEENIVHEHLYRTDIRTGTALIQIDGKGQNTIVILHGANYAFDEDCFEKIKPVIDKTEVVMLQLEMRLDITLAVMEYAHKKGKTVVLNPAPVVPIEPKYLGYADILTPNETELALLTGEKEVEVGCKKLLSYGVKTVVATLGSDGAMIADKEGFRVVPTFKVKPVDTVAAGDSFNGALVVALTEGKTVEEAVRFANAMGALTVQGKGAIPSLQNRSAVEKFLKERA